MSADRIELLDENLRYGFAQLPRPVLKAKGLSFRAKCLYSLLLDYAWQKESCFPGQERLAEDLDTSVDTIQRGLNELRAYGLIDWKQQGMNRSNVYYILKLSECQGLSGDGSSRTPQNCGILTPQNCGVRMPQECGTKNTKTKNTQSEEYEDSSKKTRRRVDEVAASPTVTATSTDAFQQGRQRREPTATRNEQHKQKPEPKLSYIGKPITQEEIDQNRRQGKNISGYTPLANIPTEHWQELEQRVAKAPLTRESTTHYTNCTRNAPLFIDATIEQFTSILGDEQENIAININRTAKLFRRSGMKEEAFRTVMYEVFNNLKRCPAENIKKRRADGRPNKMPLFFKVLEEQCK